MQNYKLFKAEVKRQLSLRDWTYKDLAKVTGYERKTLEQFMCGRRVTDNVAAAIAKALDIPEHMAT